jgi:hypothetical protein
MLVYVEWKIDLEKPNKINILRIREEKDPTLKYKIARHKFDLGDVVIDENFNPNEIYFTRVNIGKIKHGNKINVLISECVNYYDNENTIGVSMFGTLNILTISIKNTYRSNMFLNEKNWPILPENELDKELNNLTKELKKNRTNTKIVRFGNQFTLYLDEAEIEFIQN